MFPLRHLASKIGEDGFRLKPNSIPRGTDFGCCRTKMLVINWQTECEGTSRLAAAGTVATAGAPRTQLTSTAMGEPTSCGSMTMARLRLAPFIGPHGVM